MRFATVILLTLITVALSFLWRLFAIAVGEFLVLGEPNRNLLAFGNLLVAFGGNFGFLLFLGSLANRLPRNALRTAAILAFVTIALNTLWTVCQVCVYEFELFMEPDSAVMRWGNVISIVAYFGGYGLFLAILLFRQVTPGVRLVTIVVFMAEMFFLVFTLFEVAVYDFELFMDTLYPLMRWGRLLTVSALNIAGVMFYGMLYFRASAADDSAADDNVWHILDIQSESDDVTREKGASTPGGVAGWLGPADVSFLSGTGVALILVGFVGRMLMTPIFGSAVRDWHLDTSGRIYFGAFAVVLILTGTLVSLWAVVSNRGRLIGCVGAILGSAYFLYFFYSIFVVMR